VIIRAASPGDAAAVGAIYGHHVLNGLGTFEEIPPSDAEMAEESVYIHPDCIGQGLGKKLVSKVIETCEAMGLRQLVAVIGDSGNAGSLGLHRSLGFTEIGVGHGFGFKHGRWVDIVWMQRALGQGEHAPPSGPGLAL